MGVTIPAPETMDELPFGTRPTRRLEAMG